MVYYKNKFLKYFLVLFVSLFLVLFLPLILLLFSPIYLFRKIIFLIAPILRPDLAKMMTTRSTLAGIEEIYVAPKSTLVIVARLRGTLDIQTVREEFRKKVMNEKDSSGQIIRPELRQYLSSWLGFRFWKHDPKFDIKEHVKVWNEDKSTFKKSCSEIPGLESETNECDEVTDDRLTQIQKELLEKPFQRKKSPWEVWLIQNYKPRDSDIDFIPGSHMCVVLLRIHHSMADGGSLTALVLALASQKPDSVPKPHFVKRGICEKILFGISYVILAIYQFACQLVVMNDENELHNPKIVMTKKVWAASRFLPIKVFKEIKVAADVSFVSVLYAAILGGLRNFYLKNEFAVPRSIYAGVPVPLPGHPVKLRNFISFLLLKLPMGLSCPMERLMKINCNYEWLKKSTLPAMNSVAVIFLGGLFLPIVRKLTEKTQVTLVTSIVPFTSERGFLFGLPHVSCRFASGMLPGQTGVIVTVMSYVDRIAFTVELDGAICSSDAEAEDLLNLMIAEIDELKEATKV